MDESFQVELNNFAKMFMLFSTRKNFTLLLRAKKSLIEDVLFIFMGKQQSQIQEKQATDILLVECV